MKKPISRITVLTSLILGGNMTETQTKNIRTRLVKYIIEGLYKMDSIQGYRNHPIIHQFNLDVVQSIKKYLKAGEIYMYHDDKAIHDEKGGILMYIFPVFIPAMFEVFYEYPVGSDEIIFCDDPVGTYHEGLVVMERVYKKTSSVVHLAESR